MVKTFRQPRLIPKHLAGSEVPNCESSARLRLGRICFQPRFTYMPERSRARGHSDQTTAPERSRYRRFPKNFVSWSRMSWRTSYAFSRRNCVACRAHLRLATQTNAVGAVEQSRISTRLCFLSSLVGIGVEDEIAERHRGIDDQRGVMLRRFVFPGVPFTHLVAESRQAADDADKSGQSLFQAVIDAQIFGREIEMFLHPFVELRKIAVVIGRICIALFFYRGKHGFDQFHAASPARPSAGRRHTEIPRPPSRQNSCRGRPCHSALRRYAAASPATR